MKRITICLLGLLLGCSRPSLIHYSIQGGPGNVSVTLSEDGLSEGLRPLIAGAPKANAALDTVILKERGFVVVRQSSNLIALTGLVLSILGAANLNDQRATYLAAGLSTLVGGYLLRFLILTFNAEKRDYGEVLWLYNQEKPEHPYRAPRLFFPAFSQSSTVTESRK